MKTFELTPTNGRSSFGHKAIVQENNGISTLLSYTTKVATYDHALNKVSVLGMYSATTVAHINAFLEFYGFDTMTKKEMIQQFNLKN